MNHSRKPNAVAKVVAFDNVPHLCIFARRDMYAGEQVLFDYGVKQLPFHDLVRSSCH